MRFVVLHHTGWPGRADHFDLMLQFESGASDDDLILKSFATLQDAFPAGDPPCLMQRLSDHRRAYLGLEGPLSGNRGSIARVDAGELTVLAHSEPGLIEVELRGTRLNGRFRLMSRESGIYSFEKTLPPLSA